MAKILIIDDEFIIRKKLGFLLRKRGYDTFVAEDGEHGLELFHKEMPEIVLVDIKMPGMDGIEVLKKIKAESTDTEVIIITGTAELDTAIQALREGAFNYLQKPINLGELEIDIKNALEKREMKKKLNEYLHTLEKTIEEEERELRLRISAEEALKYRVEIEKLIASISTDFFNLELKDVDNRIENALRTVGEFVGVTCGCVFMFDSSGTKIESTHEWYDGVEPPIERVKDWIGNFSSWAMERLKRYEIINIPRVADLPSKIRADMEAFELQAIKSIICIPLVYGDRLAGLLHFYSVNEEKILPDEKLRLLRMVGEIFVNVIEHKKSEEVRERFRVILEQAEEAIFFVNPENGYFIDFNKTAEQLSGYSREELLGMCVQDIEVFNSLQILERWKENTREVKDSRAPLLTHGTHVCRDGTTLPVEILFSRRSFASRDYLLIMMRDISERDRARKIIDDQRQQLIQADKMASLGTMAAGVAHEINNPLNVVMGDFYLFQRDILGLTDFVKEYLDMPPSVDAPEAIKRYKDTIDIPYLLEHVNEKLARCKNSMKRIQEIVQRLRDLSHVDTGEITDIDIIREIENALKFIPNKFKENIEIVTEFGSLPHISGRGGQINQVFINIIMNALQAMKGGGILKIETSTDSAYISIRFCDTGPGISDKNIKHIFEPFYTTKPVGEGTGLGLSISYSIIEKHGGRIIVTNNIDKGVTFTMKLLRCSEKNKPPNCTGF